MWWLAIVACSGPTMSGGGTDDSGTDGGGQTGAEYPGGCEEVGRTAIAADDATELGFSLDDVTASAGGPRDAHLDWSDGGSVGLTLDLEADGTVDWVQYDESTSTSMGGLGAPDMMCSDVLEFPASVAFATDDGSFDELFALTLQASTGDAVDFWATVDADALAGSYQIRHLVDGTPNPQISIGGSIGVDGSTGTIWEQPGEAPPPPSTGTGSGSGSAGTGTAGTATAWPSFQAASWSTP